MFLIATYIRLKKKTKNTKKNEARVRGVRSSQLHGPEKNKRRRKRIINIIFVLFLYILKHCESSRVRVYILDFYHFGLGSARARAFGKSFRKEKISSLFFLSILVLINLFLLLLFLSNTRYIMISRYMWYNDVYTFVYLFLESDINKRKTKFEFYEKGKRFTYCIFMWKIDFFFF